MRWLAALLLPLLLLAVPRAWAGAYTTSASNYLSVVAAAHDIVTSSCTICVRWNPNAWSGYTTPTARETNGVTRSWRFYTPTGESRILYDGFDPTEKARATTPQAQPVQPKTLCGVFVPNTSTTLYVDGSTKYVGTVYLSFSARPGARTYIGSAEWVAGHANGSVEELAIWSRALTDAQVEDWHGGRGCSGSFGSLVGRYTAANGSSGNIPTDAGYIKDLTPNANHMTASGTPTFVPHVMTDCQR